MSVFECYFQYGGEEVDDGGDKLKHGFSLYEFVIAIYGAAPKRLFFSRFLRDLQRKPVVTTKTLQPLAGVGCVLIS